jgi:hypothetical protein
MGGGSPIEEAGRRLSEWPRLLAAGTRGGAAAMDSSVRARLNRQTRSGLG